MQQNLLIGLILFSVLIIGFYVYCNKDHYSRDGFEISNVKSAIDVSNNFFSTDPKDLLPSTQSNMWTPLNPISQTSMVIPDVLQSDYFIGVSTTGLSNKLPNLQNREDPVIEKVDTSGLWNQSSLDDR